ncbi:NAD(P)-dependent oxidoreductase [Cupriavidus basilensis]
MASGLHGKQQVLVLTRLALDAAWLAAQAPRYRFMAWSEADDGARAGARAVLTNGSTGLSAAELAALPALELVASFGAGYENIDLAAARARGVRVCHAPDTNSQVVADHALTLMLALSRGIAALDRGVKSGQWESLRAPRPGVRGKTLGIVGLGNIGGKLAVLAQAMGMQVAYLRRSAPAAGHYTPYADPIALAAASDVLALTCPGGAATHHLVDAAVLRALGPRGLLVNVARGSVVDTVALVDALARGEIAGAALDVIETEPLVPAALREMDQVILTPHLAGRSPETRVAQHTALAGNLDGWFLRGEPVHPVTLPA